MGLSGLIVAVAILACGEEAKSMPSPLRTATVAATVTPRATPTVASVLPEISESVSTPTGVPVATSPGLPVPVLSGTPTAKPAAAASPEPASVRTHSPVPVPTQVPPKVTPVPGPAHTPTATPIPTALPVVATSTHAPAPKAQPTATMTPLPVVKLSPDLNVEVTGYWSDGSASLEVAITLTNEGNLEVAEAQHLRLTCLQGGVALDGCGLDTEMAFPNGYLSETEVLAFRAPVGDVSFQIQFGRSGTHTEEFRIPGRILGVDRDVWACFSDMSNVGTVREEEEGIGCAGWPVEAVQKWDQRRPITVHVVGPGAFASEFRRILEGLSSVMNLRLEWVTYKYGANVVAYIGNSLEETRSLGGYCSGPDAFGCAEATSDIETGEVSQGEIVVYNLWPDSGSDFDDFGERLKNRFRSAMIHEAVHALGRMGHRTERRSIMESEAHERAQLSPMDEALLRLRGHPLIEPGMTIEEIRDLIIFSDELMDPQPPDVRFIAWNLVSNSHRKLREATSARYRVRSSLPGCSEEFGWADYRVGNLRARHPYFGWVRIDDGAESLYAIHPDGNQSEFWRRSQSGWNMVSDGTYSNLTRGWRADLSDPHHMLETVLEYADWSDVGVSAGADGRTRLRFELGSIRGANSASARSLEITLTVDNETFVIVGYGMTWDLVGERCARYRIDAKDGEYDIDFPFATDVRRGSDFVDDCEVEHLGLLKGYARRSGVWARECGPDWISNGYGRLYPFSLDDEWSFLRLELSSSDDARLNLWRSGEAGIVPLGVADGELKAGGHLPPVNAEGLQWAHVTLPAGDYAVEVVTLNRELPGAFTLEAVSQATPPPPHRFKSISVGPGRTCGLLLDGTPLCWGRRDVDGDGTDAPDEKFVAISASSHACALREDGTPVCWDFMEEGEHTCGPKDGAIYCRLNDQETPSDTPQSTRVGTVATQIVGVTAGYFDLTPPAGTKLASLGSGWGYNCGLQEDGTPICWGNNQHGRATPPANERFVSIVTGHDHACGLREDGAVLCWGSDRAHNTWVPKGERFVAISAGADHSCGLREDGSTLCWGDGARSSRLCTQRPDGWFRCGYVDRPGYNTASPPAWERFKSLGTGGPYCALKTDGSAACWTVYQSGLTPAPERERFTTISASPRHACGLREDGTAVCWGWDIFGQSSPPSGINATADLGVEQQSID